MVLTPCGTSRRAILWKSFFHLDSSKQRWRSSDRSLWWKKFDRIFGDVILPRHNQKHYSFSTGQQVDLVHLEPHTIRDIGLFQIAWLCCKSTQLSWFCFCGFDKLQIEQNDKSGMLSCKGKLNQLAKIRSPFSHRRKNWKDKPCSVARWFLSGFSSPFSSTGIARAGGRGKGVHWFQEEDQGMKFHCGRQRSLKIGSTRRAKIFKSIQTGVINLATCGKVSLSTCYSHSNSFELARLYAVLVDV